MNFKKALISNLDIIQVANFGAVTSVATNTQRIQESNISEQSQTNLVNNVLLAVQTTLKDYDHINDLSQTKNTEKNHQIKHTFLTKVTDNLDLEKSSKLLTNEHVKSFLKKSNLVEKYNNELVKISKEVKTTKVAKELQKAPERLLTQYNTYINNDPGTSKVIHILLEKYQKLFKVKSELQTKLFEEKQINRNIQVAIVTLSALAVFSSFIAFFVPPLAFAAASAGALAILLSAIKEYRKIKINAIKKQLELLGKLEKGNFNDVITDTAKLGLDLAVSMIQLAGKKQIANSIFAKTLSKGFSYFSFGYDFLGLVKNSVQLDDDEQELKNLLSEAKQIELMRKNYNDQWVNFKKLNKVVVVSETRQNYAYKSGGTGGTNVFFKRLIDGKIFSRKEMLSMSKYELESYNLIKVRRTVTKNNLRYSYEYLRSKHSNKLLEDNLG